MTETLALDAPRQTIYDTLDAVPGYTRYPTSGEIQDLFYATAANNRHNPDIDVKAWPTVLRMSLKQPVPGGITAYLMGGVHSCELVWLPTFDFAATHLPSNPDLMVQLGVNKIILHNAGGKETELNRRALFTGEGFTFDEYFSGSYRSMDDVELRYPLSPDADVEFLPTGTQESKYIIDRVKPKLVVPLHNASVGGVYNLVSRVPTPAYLNDLQTVMGLAGAWCSPTSPGDLRSDEIETLAPGIYRQLKHGLGYPQSFKSLQYQRLIVGASALASTNEVAYFGAEALSDNRPAGRSIAEIKQEALERMLEIAELGLTVLRPTIRRYLEAQYMPLYTTAKSRLLRQLATMKHLNEIAPDDARPATIADEAAILYRGLAYTVKAAGHAMRAAHRTGEYPTDHQEATFDNALYDAKRHLRPITVPRRVLVRTQLGSALAGMLALKEERA